MDMMKDVRLKFPGIREDALVKLSARRIQRGSKKMSTEPALRDGVCGAHEKRKKRVDGDRNKKTHPDAENPPR